MMSESLRQLPYVIHTNREFGLMLSGIKPLAMFMDAPGHFPDCVVRYLRMFDRHVAAGRFVKRVHIITNTVERLRIREWHQIFYALPGEECRIDAMIELRSRPGDWSSERERGQGRLLGYTEWQNDVWKARFLREA